MENLPTTYMENRSAIEIDIWTKAITDNGWYGGGCIVVVVSRI